MLWRPRHEGFWAVSTHALGPVAHWGTKAMTDDRWLSVDEIATYLGVKRDTIYKWIERKGMPAHKVGRLWKFRKDEVDYWVRQGESNEGDSALVGDDDSLAQQKKSG